METKEGLFLLANGKQLGHSATAEFYGKPARAITHFKRNDEIYNQGNVPVQDNLPSFRGIRPRMSLRPQK